MHSLWLSAVPRAPRRGHAAPDRLRWPEFHLGQRSGGAGHLRRYFRASFYCLWSCWHLLHVPGGDWEAWMKQDKGNDWSGSRETMHVRGTGQRSPGRAPFHWWTTYPLTLRCFIHRINKFQDKQGATGVLLKSKRLIWMWSTPAQF